jgi:hypothetical protein
MRSETSFVIILCSLIAGCNQAPSNHYIVYFDEAFTQSETIEVTNVISKWELAANQFDLSFDIRRGWILPQEEHTFALIPSRVAIIDRMYGQKIIGETTRYTGCDCGEIYFGMDLTDENERRTMIAHELGHLLSLIHTGPGTLMYPSYGPNNPNAITCKDVEQYASLRGERIVFCNESVEVASK